jgi:hypothetical protein
MIVNVDGISTISYQHDGLQHEDSFRLLLLQPYFETDDPVHITLSSHRLSTLNLDFEALSYTWGDFSDKVPIYLGEHLVLPVSPNCLDALKALRRRNKARFMWIDAICINQNDLEERSSQVRLMARIFASASSTIIYLGQHTASSRIVFQELLQAEHGDFKQCPCGKLEPIRDRPSDIVIQGLEELIQRELYLHIP